KVSEGDEVAEGSVIALVEEADADDDGASDEAPAAEEPAPAAADNKDKSQDKGTEVRPAAEGEDDEADGDDGTHDRDEGGTAPSPSRERRGPDQPPVEPGNVRVPGEAPYASPAVRAFARELGVDITQVEGSGRK